MSKIGNKLLTTYRYECVDCKSQNITMQIFVIQTDSLDSQNELMSKTDNVSFWVELEWDHDNIGHCHDCGQEVGLQEVKR